ncbi:MAG: family 43 glycosylhydrolase [Actinomycetota bacterium]
MRATRTTRVLWMTAALALLLAGISPGASAGPVPGGAPRTGAPYDNPLDVRGPDGEAVESCADPVVHRGTGDDRYWYLYCTTDPLSAGDVDENGELNFRLIPTFRSLDMTTWEYVNDAFSARPSWAAPDAGLWAPEVVEHEGTWFLYYTVPATTIDGGGSAIGVATAPGPTGPWTHSDTPAVEPHAPPGGDPNARRWTFDAEVITAADGTRWLYYGSYFGGLSVRALSDDGLTTRPGTQTQIAVGNRYEGTQIVRRDGWYYLLASATDCCRGPLTGYSVFALRSRSPQGPFVDADGASALDGRVGGTPVLSMNGNRWVGLGHHDVVQDFDGQDWMYYHAVDRFDPYFDGHVGFTKRPVLLDPLDWVDGWPTVRSGRWASDGVQLGPAAQPGTTTGYRPRELEASRPGSVLWQEDFADLSEWTWVREPAAGTYSADDGRLEWDTQAADLHEDSDTASVLTRSAPEGDFVVETTVRTDVPADGCCYNFVQGGLVLYGGDDEYLKLGVTSIWETRQTEWAKEVTGQPPGYPRYGNTVVGPAGETTWLRVHVDRRPGEDHFTAWTSRDGTTWRRGGTWTHDLGDDERIGLVSMGGSGFTTTFGPVTVSRLVGPRG